MHTWEHKQEQAEAHMGADTHANRHTWEQAHAHTQTWEQTHTNRHAHMGAGTHTHTHSYNLFQHAISGKKYINAVMVSAVGRWVNDA